MAPPRVPLRRIPVTPHPWDAAPRTPELPPSDTRQSPDILAGVTRAPGRRSQRSRPYGVPEHPLHLIPSAPTRHYGFSTPFDEHGQPCTPVIPATPKFGTGVPRTPLEEEDDVEDVLAELLGTTVSTSSTPAGMLLWSLRGMPSTTSTSTTSPTALDEVDFEADEEENEDVDDEVHDEVEGDDMVEIALDDDGEVEGTERDTHGGDVALEARANNASGGAFREDDEDDFGRDTGAGVGRILDEAAHDRHLAVYISRMVVAELYHLLRSSGVIPGPGMRPVAWWQCSSLAS